MWPFLNRSINAVFDLWLWPFQGLSPTWQICALALPLAIVALLVFRFASNQRGIEAAKDLIKAHLLELWLFKDDMRVTLRAQRQILRHSLAYMGHALVPMAVMAVPFILVIIQVESHYALRSLNPGESTILTVRVAGNEPVSALDATLSLPAGLTQETPALRIDATAEMMWRIRAVKPGEHQIGLQIAGKTYNKSAVVGDRQARPSPARYRADDLKVLLYPAEDALASDSGLIAIELVYPRRRAVFAGLSSASWLLLGVSLGFGYLLRGRFGVTF